MIKCDYLKRLPKITRRSDYLFLLRNQNDVYMCRNKCCLRYKHFFDLPIVVLGVMKSIWIYSSCTHVVEMINCQGNFRKGKKLTLDWLIELNYWTCCPLSIKITRQLIRMKPRVTFRIWPFKWQNKTKKQKKKSWLILPNRRLDGCRDKTWLTSSVDIERRRRNAFCCWDISMTCSSTHTDGFSFCVGGWLVGWLVGLAVCWVYVTTPERERGGAPKLPLRLRLFSRCPPVRALSVEYRLELRVDPSFYFSSPFVHTHRVELRRREEEKRFFIYSSVRDGVYNARRSLFLYTHAQRVKDEGYISEFGKYSTSIYDLVCVYISKLCVLSGTNTWTYLIPRQMYVTHGRWNVGIALIIAASLHCRPIHNNEVARGSWWGRKSYK